MAYAPVNDGDLAIAPSVQQIIDSLSGVSGAGQAIQMTTFGSETEYALQLRNEGSTGRTFRARTSADVETVEFERTHSRFDTDTLFIDNVNHRVGIGTSSPTVALDIEGDVTISGTLTSGSGGYVYQTGPFRYDVEAYALADDLNADGTFKFDRSCTYAVNAAAAAVRVKTFSGDGGTFGGRYNAKIVFNSPVYFARTPMNLTKLNGAAIEASGETTTIYCGNAFTTAGAYDSGVSGSGTTITAANSPMMDLTGCSDCAIRGIRLYAQASEAGGVPAVKPGAGFLVASLEVRSGGVFNGTGGTFSSNNLVFERCATVGWFGAAGYLICNSVIHNFTDSGGQNWNDSANAHVFYAGRQTIGPASATPTASGGVDSPFYPDPSSPANGDERMNRTETAAGGLTFTNCEFHDMTGTARLAINALDTGRSATLSTMLFYKVYQVLIQGTSPMSSTGRAGIEAQGFLRGMELNGVEFYEDSSISGGSPLYWIYAFACSIQDTIVQSCFMNAGSANLFGGEQNGGYNGVVAKGNTNNGSLIMDTSLSYSGSATTETLTGMCEIECGGLGLTIGGSISATVNLIVPGTVSVSGGGNDKHTEATSIGTVRRQPGTVSSPAYGIAGSTAANQLGWYQSSSGVGALVSGGVERMTWSSSGITTPLNFKAGAIPATTGGYRASNAAGLYARNIGNTANVRLAELDASDNLGIGDTTNVSLLQLQSANGHRFASGGNYEFGTAAIPTNATVGFVCMPTCAGTPTGAAAPTSGLVPWIYDTSANKIWVRSGGTWRGVVVA